MKPKHRTTLSLVALPGLVLLAVSSTLHAQTAWDGGGGNTDYSNNLNWAGDIIPGDGNASGALIGSSSTQAVVYNTATSYTSTGTAKANSLLVGTSTGTDGVGSLTLSGSAGTLTFGGDGYGNAAWIGTSLVNGNATGTVTVSAGKLAIGTGAGSDASINLGVTSGGLTGTKNGTLIIDGGTVEVGRRILMGANSTTLATGLLTISSGTLEMKRTGSTAEGDLGMIRFGSGFNTVNLDGGTVIFSGFHTSGASNLRSTIYLNGTTLKANATIADLFIGTTSTANYRLKNGGLVVDTNTFAVTINDALTQETGHVAILRKEGVGTLTISGLQANRTGTTTVNGGTLLVSTTGSIGTGATTVTGSGSILTLDRNDTWGSHSTSTQALTIQSGGVVTNGTQINRGFNTVKTLALDGGELRVTGTARAVPDGDLYKFEAYSIQDSITVTGTTASLITNPGTITNAGINIGGFTNLGGGIGADLIVNVADVTASSAPDLTVSAVLKNNYDNSGSFTPLSNGLMKTGVGTLALTAINRYTGPTTVIGGKLTIGTSGTINNTSGVTIGAGDFNYNNSTTALTQAVTFSGSTGTLSGTGTITPAVTITSGNRQTAGSSVTTAEATAVVGKQTFSTGITYNEDSIFEWNLNADNGVGLGSRGTDYDAIDAGALATTGAKAIFRIVLNGANNYSETFWNTERIWSNIFTGLDGITAFDLASIFNSSVQTYNSGGEVTGITSGSFTISGTDLKWSAVPEPTSALAGLLLGAGLLRRRR